MIDWFTGYIGYDASGIRLGHFLEVDHSGAVVRHRDRWETAVGSFASSMQVTRVAATEAMVKAHRTLGFPCASAVLAISGNPAKFLQGHNVWGPSVEKLGPVMQAVVRSFAEGFRPTDADDTELRAVHRSRVDVTTACDLGSHNAVHEYLRHLGVHGRTHQGRALVDGDTVYFQKHSSRWTLKFYCKHCELHSHRPDCDSELIADLLDWTRPLLRVELTLRRPELRHRGTLNEGIIWDFVQRLEVSGMAPKDQPADTLRGPVQLALAAWYDGRDLASLLSHGTFYRYRRQILDATGIDVKLPRKDQDPKASAALVRLDELRALEVKDVPDRIQRSLFGSG